MTNAAPIEPPAVTECQAAMKRALEVRFQAHRSAEACLHFTDAAILERLTGLPLPEPLRGRDAWWRVGSIVDQIADKAFDVWYRPPVPRRLALTERRPATRVEPKPPAVVPDGIQALYRSRWEQERNGS